MKFKVWDDKKQRWSSSQFFVNQKGDLCKWGTFSQQLLLAPKHYIAVFSTETHDKNGTELFDGDILKRLDGSICYIGYKDCCFCTVNIDTGDTNLLSKRNHFEKIGTKLENPELLEE